VFGSLKNDVMGVQKKVFCFLLLRLHNFLPWVCEIFCVKLGVFVVNWRDLASLVE